MKKVLVLGASGNIAPYVTPDLEKDYDLYLSRILCRIQTENRLSMLI